MAPGIPPNRHDNLMDIAPSSAEKLPPSLFETALSTMNENLVERFGRGNAFRRDDLASAQPPSRPMTLNSSIRNYVRDKTKSSDPSLAWTSLPEIPTATEIWTPADKSDEYNEDLVLQENIVVGPYESKEQYLECHYSLLREDAVAPLRESVREIQLYPALCEKDSEASTCIYERAHITGFTFARIGVAARVTFSLKRIGKQVNWEQSTRLRTGTMLALTPASDQFRSICRVAIVAARPLTGLLQNPPAIDIFFGQADEIEIDPQEEWLMVESRTGYFEGHRHTLQALQHLHREAFPLARHIVYMDRQIEPPDYVKEQPVRDLRQAFLEVGGDTLKVNILDQWPDLPSTLDTSQLQALKRAMTKSLAIIQGPPGTGKTYLSVMAIRLMLENSSTSDPPIIVTAQTNHALDQLLRHISKFEPNFIRLGAMTQDFDIIQPRTLFEVKKSKRPGKLVGGLRDGALAKLKRLTVELTERLAPLSKNEDVHPPSLFRQYRIITEKQYQSLIEGAKEWISGSKVTNEMGVWLGDERVEPRRFGPEDLGFQEIEEDELDFEQLQEVEGENKKSDNDEFETLKGNRIELDEPWTGRNNAVMSAQAVTEELKKPNLWAIPREFRGSVYRRLQSTLKQAIRDEVRKSVGQYTAAAQDGKIGKYEVDYNYLWDTRIIGVTTTGLGKYRALIQSLNPKIVLIEEAAETFESFASIACMPSLQQLILVGDHAQLRGNPNDDGLAGPPFFLDVSLLERMVRNKVEYTQLNVQRRMLPEIRRGLSSIYEDLKDHPSVNGRAPVPGMGGVNSFFFTHNETESSDDHMSKLNHTEADMVCQFFVYLNKNGVSSTDITILTSYQGQRKLLIKKLRKQSSLRGQSLEVHTVDSYQGEENAVVILSLVRSNRENNIGFLANENRTCVALSRAQRGFYIFGNAPSLCKSSSLWWHVVQTMAEKPCRVGFRLPVTCSNHKNTTFLQEPSQFPMLQDGGCLVRCDASLDCGHTCPLYCHPYPHESIKCEKRCTKKLSCGHACIETCAAECKSDCKCYAPEQDVIPSPSHHGAPKPLPSRSVAPFRKYAEGGHVDADLALAARLAAQQLQDQVQEGFPNSAPQPKNLDLERRANAQFADAFPLLPGSSKVAKTSMGLPGSGPSTTDMRVLRQQDDGRGGVRSVYRETYSPAQPASLSAKPVKKEGQQQQQPKHQQQERQQQQQQLQKQQQQQEEEENLLLDF